MTTELEKQFFQCFGIEPYREPSREYNSDGEICSWYIEYPQITDRHYLEFICITRRYALSLADTISETKNRLLRFLIDNNTLFKHQVQAIFEGEINGFI